MKTYLWSLGTLRRAALVSAVSACAGRTLALPSDNLSVAMRTQATDGGLPRSSADGGITTPQTPTSIFPRNSGVLPHKTCAGTADAQGLVSLVVDEVTHSFRAPIEYNSKAPAPVPLLVVLHGCGDSANNAAKWMGNLWESRPEDIHYLVLGVGGRDGACWGDDSALVRSAVDALAECIYVDRRRIVIGGYSSGGELGLRLMYAHGGDYAGLLLEHSGLSQAYPNTDLSALSKRAPWAFPVTWVAGTNDSVFPIAQAHTERDLLKEAGQPLKFIETADDHEGRSIPNWSGTLLPTMASWVTPLPQ